MAADRLPDPGRKLYAWLFECGHSHIGGNECADACVICGDTELRSKTPVGITDRPVSAAVSPPDDSAEFFEGTLADGLDDAVSPAEPPEAGIWTLADHVDAALAIALRLDTGHQHWSDTTTLLAHLHVIKEDYCDAR